MADVIKGISALASEKEAIAALCSWQEGKDMHQFWVGGALARMQEEGWYGKAEDFYEFVGDTAGIEKRKAQYLMRVYRDLSNLDVQWSQVRSLGWTKLFILSTVLTPENAKDVLGRARGMSTREVTEFAKDLRDRARDAVFTGGGDDDESTVTFKVTLHKDQEKNVLAALDKAKAESSTEYAAVALENICLDYLAGGAKEQMTIRQAFDARVRDLGGDDDAREQVLDETGRMLAKLFPDEFTWEEEKEADREDDAGGGTDGDDEGPKAA